MKVNPLNVGPIVGEVTSSTIKVFGRAKPIIEDGLLRQGHLVLRLRRVIANRNSNWESPNYFKLNPNFDFSAVGVWEGLQSSRAYEYQCGYIFSDVATEDIDVDSVLDWSAVTSNSVTTASNNSRSSRSIAFGSCRYLLKLFGGDWFDDRGDKAFRSLFTHHINKKLDLFIMAGDQIYADDLNIASADTGLDQYYERYRTVFSQKFISLLMSNVPTLMTLDDHEIEDNWPESASSKDMLTKYPVAMHAYQTYQSSHSPLCPIVNGRISSPPDRLWYTHIDGCCEYFFVDSRTERDLGPQRKIISENQMDALRLWLTNGSGLVKIIVTSVPFWESTSKDKWNGFIDQRDTILKTISDNKLNKVVFLSGDVHASMSSQLDLGAVSVLSIVSSSFFWPYPHPKPNDFLLSGHVQTNSGNSYRVKNASRVISNDSYCVLGVSRDEVKVKFFGRKGKREASKTYKF